MFKVDMGAILEAAIEARLMANPANVANPANSPERRESQPSTCQQHGAHLDPAVTELLDAAMRACDPEYWIKHLAWTYPQSPTVIVSDWTHPDDAKWLAHRAKLVKIRVSAYADVCDERGSGGAHDPAQFLLYGDTGCTEIVNNDTIADLRKQVVKMLTPHMG